MKSSSLLKSTLCGLILATAVSTNISAQKNKSNDEDLKRNFSTHEYFDAVTRPKSDTIYSNSAIGCAGLAISHFNPVLSIGFKIRKNKKQSNIALDSNGVHKTEVRPHRFSLYSEMALYMPVKPYHEDHTELYRGGINPRLYRISLYEQPLVRCNLLVSSNNFTFGGGLLLVNKVVGGVPELSSNSKLAVGYTGILGVDITPLLSTLFPRTKNRYSLIKNQYPLIKNRLELEGTLSYIPESMLSRGLDSYALSKAIDSLDKGLLRVSLGFRYWIK